MEIKKGYSCGLRITLTYPNNSKVDIRNSKYLAVSLILPNNTIKPIKDVGFDEVTGTIFVRLSGGNDLNTIGKYSIHVNVQDKDARMLSTVKTPVLNVTYGAFEGYGAVVLSLALYSVETPGNVSITGASPQISPQQTWLVYDDTLKSYIDTGIQVRGDSAFQTWLQQPGNEDKTYEDYEAWLRQPATEAGERADEAAERAHLAADQADIATDNADEATKNADKATVAAKVATENAKIVTGEAQEATKKAQEATQGLEGVKSECIAATNNANIAAERAQTNATNAKNEADAARGATVKAQEAATSANSAAAKAQEATQEAEEATREAQEAAQNANNATGTIDNKLDKTGNGKDVTVTFTEASSRAVIYSRENLSLLFGKIKRWFSDLKSVAFTGKASDLTQDTDNRLVTDTEKANWNDKYTRTEVDNKDAAGLQAAKEYAAQKIAEIVNGSPAALDTLQELAAALGNDPNFATSIMALLGGKADRNELNSKVNVDGSSVMSGALYINNSATGNGLRARFAKNAAGDAVVMSLNDVADVALCSLAVNVSDVIYFNSKASYNLWHAGNLIIAPNNSVVAGELSGKIPKYTQSGYLNAVIFRDSWAKDDSLAINEIGFRVSQEDGCHRWCSLARLKTALGSMPANGGNADTVGGLPLSYIMRRNSGAEIQANAILGTSQYGFGYETKGFPISGSFISFGGFGDDYTTQIIASYKGDRIYFRTYDGDLKKWNGWQRLARYSEALLNSGEQTLSRGRFNMLVSAREHVIMFKDAAGDIGYIGFGVYPTKDLQIYNYATGKYINIAADGKLYYDGKELATVDQLTGNQEGIGRTLMLDTNITPEAAQRNIAVYNAVYAALSTYIDIPRIGITCSAELGYTAGHRLWAVSAAQVNNGLKLTFCGLDSTDMVRYVKAVVNSSGLLTFTVVPRQG